MNKNLASKFSKVAAVADVIPGDKLAWESWNCDGEPNTSLYWAVVSKVTPKSVTVTCPDAPSYKQREMQFRMKKFYNGGPEYFEPYGDAQGNLYRLLTPDAVDVVLNSYTARAEEKVREEAFKAAKAQEYKDRVAKDRAAALAANPDTTFVQFTALGDDKYYHGFVTNEAGRTVLAVVAVRRMKNDSWDKDERENKPFIWKAVINYAENRDQQYGPRSMGSVSDVKADSIEELFQNVICRMWD